MISSAPAEGGGPDEGEGEGATAVGAVDVHPGHGDTPGETACEGRSEADAEPSADQLLDGAGLVPLADDPRYQAASGEEAFQQPPLPMPLMGRVSLMGRDGGLVGEVVDAHRGAGGQRRWPRGTATTTGSSSSRTVSSSRSSAVTGIHRGEYQGLPPTGRTVTCDEIFIVRFTDGRVAEIRGVVDVLTQLRQLGAFPS